MLASCHSLAESVNLAISFGNAVAFEGFCAVGDFKAVRAVGESRAVEAVVGVAFDGFLGGCKGFFAAVVCEDQSVILGQ